MLRSAKRSTGDMNAPERWALWAEDLAYEAATTRLLRELRFLLGGLDVLAPTVPNMAFALESLGGSNTCATAVAAGAVNTNLLSIGNKPTTLLEGFRATAVALCMSHSLSMPALTAAAAGSLSHTSAGGSRRLGALCLLLHALDRPIAADAAVCAAAGRLVQCCSVHGRAHLEDLSLRAAQARASDADADADPREEDAKSATGTELETETAKKKWYHQLAGLGSASGPKPPETVATGNGKTVKRKRKEENTQAVISGLGLENLRPHLSELRSAAFQLELCLSLHAQGCLKLSARARAEAAVGFRAGLLVEAFGRR